VAATVLQSGGLPSAAVAINSLNESVGWVQTGSGRGEAALWSASGQETVLSEPGGPGITVLWP
jgi:hypothetical protein